MSLGRSSILRIAKSARYSFAGPISKPFASASLIRANAFSFPRNFSTEQKSQEEEDVPVDQQLVELENRVCSLVQDIKKKDEELVKAREKLDLYLRAIADAENTNKILKRDVQNAKLYGITSFAKGLLEVADCLHLSIKSVENKELAGDAKTMYEGITMTTNIFSKAMEKQGIVKFDSLGEKFDPNVHDGVYAFPDPSKEPGTVGAVMKEGYKIQDRVLRPASVGTVSHPPEADK